MEGIRSRNPADVLAKVETRDFLIFCLGRAKLDPDLLEDVADACELQDPPLTAVSLACSELTADEAGDKLFLMQDEAKMLLIQCKRQCLKEGVDFGDGSKFESCPEDDEGAPAGTCIN